MCPDLEIHTYAEGAVGVIEKGGGPDRFFHCSTLHGAARALAMNAVVCAIQESYTLHNTVANDRTIWTAAAAWQHVLLGRMTPGMVRTFDQLGLEKFFAEKIRQA